jgi:putative endonuclease
MAGLDPAIQEQRMKSRCFVYILASKRNGTLYIGVTNNLMRRSYEHREGKGSIFTKRYEVHNLVYAEEFSDVTQAIQRESNLKHWPRRWKIELIEKLNPEWVDLYETLV